MSTPPPLRNHNDAPVTTDDFGRQEFIQAVCKEIQHCQPPKGLAINGYWGTGKTSALRLVYARLSGKQPDGEPASDKSGVDKSIVPVWFEAWRYQQESQPIVGLLNEIRAQMGLWQKFKDKAGKLTDMSLLGAFTVFDEVIKTASGGLLNPQLGKLGATGAQWEAQHYQAALPSETIRQLLEAAITKALGKANKLVIFVDDLDRCAPTSALQLLEGIKVYLNLSNCVVLFGMDQRQIEQALIKAWGLKVEKDTDRLEAAYQAREYLEKICQDIYHLPLPNLTVKANFFKTLLEQLDPQDQTPWQQHQQALAAVLQKYDCLPANPRKIKALVNRVSYVLRQVKEMGDGQDQIAADNPLSRRYALLLALSVVYCFHRLLHEQLQKNPSYINVLVSYATHEEPLELLGEALYEPMREIKPSIKGGVDLPTNPSDGNVFRLHALFLGLGSAAVTDIQDFLDI